MSEGEDRPSHAWMPVAIFALMSSVYFAADAFEMKHHYERALETEIATANERRQCGAQLEWCLITAKGTCDWVAERLRDSEAPLRDAR